MPFVSLADRLSTLPKVLCGPILRRVTRNEVSVFVALRVPAKITLDVYEAGATATGEGLLSGTRSTTELGPHLHVVVVTAQPGVALAAGRSYAYNLRFGPPGTDTARVGGNDDLLTAGWFHRTSAEAAAALTYGTPLLGPPGLPSFTTPPATVAELRVLHASCRKPHGEGLDMLPTAGQIIGEAIAAGGAGRPHHLFLTGDQIYADDVADQLLHVLIDAGKVLLGRDEVVPTLAGPVAGSTLGPGRRGTLANSHGLTSQEARSHLLTFAEFCAMYLHAWSPVLWPPELPTATEVGLPADDAHVADQADLLAAYRSGLDEVRRVLANVPTLTIFDDHEVTDDWFLDQQWNELVIHPGDPTPAGLGNAVVRNGTAAYAVFQAWGNTPEQFTVGRPGADLLAALEAWTGDPVAAHASSHPLREIERTVGFPTGLEAGGLTRAAGHLVWSYHVDWGTHEVLVLDTRTERRTFDGAKEWDPADLIGLSEVWARQIRDVGPRPAVSKLVLVVSPGPVFGVPAHELAAEVTDNPNTDPEHWALRPLARERLVAELLGRFERRSSRPVLGRVVVLSGDVHHGSAAWVRYVARRAPFLDGAPPVEGVVVQLTSSSLKNQSGLTEALHMLGYATTAENTPAVLLELVPSDALVIPAGSTLQELKKELRPSADVHGWLNTAGVRAVAGSDASGSVVLVNRRPTLHVDRFSRDVGRLDPPRPVTWNPGFQPDWSYALRAVRGVAINPGSGPPPVTSVPAEPLAALGSYLQGVANHAAYTKLHAGLEIVGRNNLGDVTFEWPDGDAKLVQQDLWWQLGAGAPAPLTRYRIPLPAGEAPVVRYGNLDLCRGDHDADGSGRARWAGVDVAAPPATTHVSTLLDDLITLGFGLAAGDRPGPGTPAFARFGRRTEWAVREFQIAAAMPSTALADSSGSVDGHSLVLVPPGETRFTGPPTGALDARTRELLGRWLDRGWRNPVVVRAVRPDGNRVDDIWLAPDAAPAQTRILVRDLSGAWTLPADRAVAGFHPLGRFVEASGGGGPTTLAPLGGGPPGAERHVWSEAEVGPLSVRDGAFAITLSPAEVSTFRVVRAAAEASCGGFVDASAFHGTVLAEIGLLHWALKSRADGTVEGEFAALLAYAQWAAPDAAHSAWERFGIRARPEWTGGARPDGQALLNSLRAYTGRLEVHTRTGWLPLPPDAEEAELLRTYRWVHRVAMAARTLPAWRRAMYEFARIRLRDLATLPWGTTGVGDVALVGGSRDATLADVVTSEQGWAALLRWHAAAPDQVVDARRAGDALHGAIAAAGASGDPDAWTDATEAAIIEAIIEAPSGAGIRSGVLAASDWPTWSNAGLMEFLLDTATLGTDLLAARGSFRLDADRLPPIPDYTR